MSILGGGFVGVTTAARFAEQGHDVCLVEVDPARRAALQKGDVPFYEPGLAEAVAGALQAGRLRVVATPAEAPAPEALFLCVGTPAREDGAADLRFLEAAAESVGACLEDWGAAPVVVVKSTVPPGTTTGVVLPALARHGRLGADFHLAANPEFLREGTALADARRPDRVVLGVADAGAEAVLRRLYAGETCPVVVTDPATAELVKYASNAMLALRIAFANEMANLSEQVGVQVDDVMRVVGLDPRIGPAFLRAGCGFGGSCFPKDLAALTAVARAHGVTLGLLEATLAHNAAQPLRAVALAREALGSLQGRRVALLGLAFKPDTSDVRESRALPIHAALVTEGAQVVVHDPRAAEEFARAAAAQGPVEAARSASEALQGADACIVQTEWPEYRALAPAEFLERMRTPVVVDARRHLDGAALRAAGVTYLAIGDGTAARERAAHGGGAAAPAAAPASAPWPGSGKRVGPGGRLAGASPPEEPSP